MKYSQIKQSAGFLLLFVLMLVIAGCSSKAGGSEPKPDGDSGSVEETKGADDGTPKQGGEIVIALGTDISNYDPIKGSSGDDPVLLWPVFDALISFTPELEPMPGLAESWEMPDDKTMILHLREGVKFHDGTIFDAEAVKFNLDRVKAEDSIISDYDNVETVEVTDPTTVTLHLKQADSSILMALSNRGGMMVSPTAFKESGEEFPRKPIGAGPYKMVEHIPNGEIVLEAFEDYWQDGKPYLDKITVKVMPEENTRINALKSGEVDYIDNISPGNKASIEKDSKLTLKEIIPIRFRNLYINTSIAPLDNKEFRLAIQHGINREELINAINFGDGEPASEPFSKKYWAADKEIEIEYDPERSKQLLKEANVENPSFTISHNSVAYESRLADAIKSQLNEIGIQVELQPMELQAAVANYFSEKGVASFLATYTGAPDPNIPMTQLFSKDSFYNPGGYSTPEMEKLIVDGTLTYDPEERRKIYGELSRIGILEDPITIPLYFSPSLSAVSEKVKGYEPNLLGKSLLSTFWLDE